MDLGNTMLGKKQDSGFFYKQFRNKCKQGIVKRDCEVKLSGKSRVIDKF